MMNPDISENFVADTAASQSRTERIADDSEKDIQQEDAVVQLKKGHPVLSRRIAIS